MILESVIRERQRAYDGALRRSDRKGDCTPFLETRLEKARAHFKRAWFTRAHYLRLHVRLSTATASRDLAAGVERGELEPRGAARMTEYRFSRGTDFAPQRA